MHTFKVNLPAKKAAKNGIAQPVLILNLSDVTSTHAPGSFAIRNGEFAVSSSLRSVSARASSSAER
jgi:hypothetical protein